MMRSAAFTALDTDKDGTISAEEIASASTSLKTLDKNGDGRITEDEVRPTGGRGPGGRGGGREGRGGGNEPGETAPPSVDEMVANLMAFDKNGDGKLTRDEVPERMQGLFDRADADKDGVLTTDEIRKMAQSLAAPAGRANAGGREGVGREGGGREGRGPRMSIMKMDPILVALDIDGDGVISAEEIANAPASLKKLDKNNDGKLTQDEVRMNMGPGRGN